MAVAVQSTASTGLATATSTVITKPTGTAVGDLLIAFILSEIGVNQNSVPSGWSVLRTSETNVRLVSYYKIATSTEVAASNFTWGVSSSAVVGGGILRIDGFPAGDPFWADNGGAVSNSATPSVAAGVTPSIANSLLIQAWGCTQGTGTLSTYAVATSDPTWTEAFESTTADGADYTIGVAYANRTETTATGNVSVATTGAATSDWDVQLIAIAPGKDFTQTDTVTETDTVIGDHTSTYSETITETDTQTFEESGWVSTTKSATSWTNTSK